jgi:chromosome partitioning protein
MIIAVATQKGGTGKTTTAISLAAGLGQAGKKVLLVDIDSQANSSKVLLPDYEKLSHQETVYRTILDREPLSIYPTNVEHVDIVPSHILMSNTDVELTTAKDHREARLKDHLHPVAGNYDHVIIDCPPSLGWLTVNAFTAANQIMIVVSPGYFELDSLVQIGKTIEEIREYFNPQLELLGILFTMSEATVNSRTSLQILRQTYTSKVFKTVIPKNTDIKDAHFQRQDIFTYKSTAPSALAYKKLLKEIDL